MTLRRWLPAFLLVFLAASHAAAQIVAYDMVGSASQNLTTYTNPWNGAFASTADGFQKYQRGVSPSIPFAVLDDSLVIFPTDSLGIIKDGNTDEFFGIVDTENPDNTGPISATWVFDVSSAGALDLSVDMGAMGDFESTDSFTWTYSIDGGPTQTAFANTVDEAGSHTYTLEGGANITLSDPMLMNGTILSNDLQTFTTTLTGSGSALTLTLTAQFDGGTEAVAFQNIVITEGVASSPLVINEILADPAGDLTGDANGDGTRDASQDELVEIVNDGATDVDISGWTLSDAVGVRHTFPAGSVVTADCAVVVFGGGTPTGSFGGAVVQTASTGLLGLNNAGDSVTLNDGSADVVSYTYGGEGGSDQSLTRDPDVTGSDPLVQHSTATGSGGALFSPGAQVDGSTFAGCTVVAVPAEIFEIQGAGGTSPLAGFAVTTDDNLVTAVGPDGFFMQTPAARTDGDVDTSDGIFVYTGGAPGVAVGDQVDVTGLVQEFFELTEIAGPPTVSVDSSGNPLPAPVLFDAATPSPDPAVPSCAVEYECWEGMLVQVIGGAVSAANQSFGSDPVAEVHVVAAAQRAFREPGVEYPGLPGLPLWDGNPEVFELDPDKLGLANQIIAAGSSFTATGALGFEFGGYELWPSSLSVSNVPALPGAVRPRDEGELTIGSLNMYRFFDDVDDPPDGAGRNDSVVSPAEYLIRRAKLVRYVVDVLGAPDVLAVQEVEKLGVLADLAGDIAARDASLVYVPYLVEGNDIGTIDVGFLVRDTVVVSSVTQLGAAEILTYDGSLLHDRPPLLLDAAYIDNGLPFPFKVLVVHARSLSGIDDPADGDRVRTKRLEQAQSIAQMVQNEQDADPGVRLVVAGDFNAFEFSDGYVDLVGRIAGVFNDDDDLVVDASDLVDPDLTNQVLSLPDAERYSFVFSGTAQVLDHALTSQAVDPFARGYAYGRGNADAAEIYIDDDTTALRSSDHDGLVLYLMSDFDGDGLADDVDPYPTHFGEPIPALGALGATVLALLLVLTGAAVLRRQ